MSSANLLQHHEPIGRPRRTDIEQIAVVLLRQVDVSQRAIDGGGGQAPRGRRRLWAVRLLLPAWHSKA